MDTKKKHTQDIPAKLYHGTRAIHLQAILAESICPREDERASQWEHTAVSRPDAVYLTSAYPLYFATEAKGDGDLVIFEIDTDMLEDSRLIADEDALALQPNAAVPRHWTPEQKAEHFKLTSHEHSAEKSLSILGTCAHLGVIPKESIVRYAIIKEDDLSRLIFGGFDPSISPMNFKLFGYDYSESVGWIFGDREICAINPRLPRPNIELVDLTPPKQKSTIRMSP